MKTTPFGPGDETTWGPYEGHPNDPREPLEDTFEDDAAAFERDLRALVQAARRLTKHCDETNTAVYAPDGCLARALRDALDQFEPWLEE